MREIHKDYSQGDSDAVVMMIRPHNRIGDSMGGHWIKIARSELNHPAVASALVSEEEVALAEQMAEAAARAGAAVAVPAAVEAQLGKIVKEREAKKAPKIADAGGQGQ